MPGFVLVKVLVLKCEEIVPAVEPACCGMKNEICMKLWGVA